MADMMRAIQALGERVESLASDRNQLMADVKELKGKSAVGSDKVSGSVVESVSVALEGASVRACRPPSPGPLASSQAQGRSNVVRPKGSTGFNQRTDVPSVVSDVSCQDRPTHKKTREPIYSSSAEDVSRKKQWTKVSRPLKRKSVPSAQVQRPSCSHWVSSDSLQSSDDCTPPKRGKAVPQQAVTPSVAAPATVDPKWSLLQSMQTQLTSLMQDFRAEKVDAAPVSLQPTTVVRPVDAEATFSRTPAVRVPPPMRSVPCQPHVDVQRRTEPSVDVRELQQQPKLFCFNAVRQPPQPTVVTTTRPQQTRQSGVDALRPRAAMVVASSQTGQQFHDVASSAVTHAPVLPDSADQPIPTPLPLPPQYSDDGLSDDDDAAHLDEPHTDIDEPKTTPPSLDFRKVLALFKEMYPDQFVSAAPRSPPSEFALGTQSSAPAFTKLVLARSSKRALRVLGDWMQSKKHLGKTAFLFPPAKLASRSSVWYATGEVLGLGVPASAQGDFSSLVDSPRRLAMRRSKICWTPSDLDHLMKGVFRAFEVFNFLDWCLGALSRKTSPSDKETSMLIMSCMDKAIRDGSSELAASFVSGVLKKRENLCSFLSAGVTQYCCLLDSKRHA
ncbi:uncharacterized protein [Palaemon carinicauda]|uniref:uncharacterized protein n=1 Tax=Palaemon carinicauda TaxID=392227 RepID=UPI0035B5DF41